MRMKAVQGMPVYDLRSDEMVLLRTGNAEREDAGASQSGTELVLTNFRIIYAWQTVKIFSRNIDHQDVFPLAEIKIVNGQVQARYHWEKGRPPQLRLYFINGEVTFDFFSGKELSSKREVLEWMDAISMQLTGQPSLQAASVRTTLPGVEMVANVIKGTVDIFKESVLGMSNAPTIEMVSKKCIGCMAPISGRRGQTVRCEYCDTTQTL